MSDAREKLLTQFRELVGERLEKISRDLIVLEAGPNPDAGKNALRELHGLKGEARMMGFQDINRVVHEMEDLVRSAQPSGFVLAAASIDALLVASDAVLVLAGTAPAGGSGPPEIDKLVDWLKQRVVAEAQKSGGAAPPAASAAQAPAGASSASASPAPAPTPSAAPAAPQAPVEPGLAVPVSSKAPRAETRLDASIRISQQSLDALTTQVGNLGQLARSRELDLSRRLQLARELTHIARAAEDLGPAAGAMVARLNRAKDLAAEIHREGKLRANEEFRELSGITEEVQDLRMLPLSHLFEPYPRMVRELARELGKDVDLSVAGEDTRADRSVLEALKDPLMHLVRNALDHGLEPRDVREKAGKAPRGHLTLSAAREGERILIRVEDDGAGIDPAALRKAAVRRGLLEESAATALSDEAARDLVFVSGFSSKEKVTDISGRGVGLDVVRVRLQGLGGDVALQSAPGRGSSFELRVPVSLTVAPLLFVQVGEEQLCVTAAHVATALTVDPAQIREIAGKPAVAVDEEIVPFASVSSILGMTPRRGPLEGELVLVVRGQGSSAAISVDRVLEERAQSILPLKGVLSRFKHLSGATALADGSLALVLSASHLIDSTRGTLVTAVAPMTARAAEARRRRIMVVDDSPLTRELIVSLLEAVGYEVVSAVDGADALDKLGRDPVEMVVTDLEMPKVDGLELTRRVKSHPTLRRLPVIIVTTRGAEADRRKGMEAGADGYIAKGDLVRQDLVDVVARLLG